MTNNICYRTVTRRRSRGRKGGRWRRGVREEEEEVEEERFKVNEKEEEDNTKNTEKRLTDLTILARADH